MISESTIAMAAADYLVSEGHETFFEVSLDWKLRGQHAIGDARADIVSTCNGELNVVECKAVLSFELLSQADRWQRFADKIWIAVPKTKRSEGKDEAYRLCRDFYGFGILEFRDPDVVRARAFPRFKDRESEALLDSLAPQHKTHARPGTNRGGQWTSFRGTAEAVSKFVAANPACTIQEAVAATEHHYASKSSAIASLHKAARKGLLPGVKVGWKQRLYPVEVAAVAEDGTR